MRMTTVCRPLSGVPVEVVSRAWKGSRFGTAWAASRPVPARSTTARSRALHARGESMGRLTFGGFARSGARAGRAGGSLEAGARAVGQRAGDGPEARHREGLE